MKTIEVKEGQTMIDIAMQHCGNIDVMMDIVEANDIVTVNDATGFDIDLSEALVPGQLITIEDAWVTKIIVKDLTQDIATASL